VGCFRYSPVDGAAANGLAAAVPAEVAEERWQRFMATAARISAARLAARVGRIEPVIVDEGRPAEGHALARSRGDAPEIDGRVRIEDGGGLRAGDMVEVEVTGAGDYDLQARLLAAQA
jgi:ribosomal protein S12 methylthiotransferase